MNGGRQGSCAHCSTQQVKANTRAQCLQHPLQNNRTYFHISDINSVGYSSSTSKGVQCQCSAPKRHSIRHLAVAASTSQQNLTDQQKDNTIKVQIDQDTTQQEAIDSSFSYGYRLPQHIKCATTTTTQSPAAPARAPILKYAPGFDSIEDAVQAIKNGESIVVIDDECRENEGDLIIAGASATPQQIAFFVRYTSGVICASMPEASTQRLGLPLMVDSVSNTESMYTAFTITVDAAAGTTTGISAYDRSKTIQLLSDPGCQSSDFKKPGHIFPLIARGGGVLVRPGHTEAALDLTQMAGMGDVGALCELVNDDGTMKTTVQLLEFAKEHGLRCMSIADLIRYRAYHEHCVSRQGSAAVAGAGALEVVKFTSSLDSQPYLCVYNKERVIAQPQGSGSEVYATSSVPVDSALDTLTTTGLPGSPVEQQAGESATTCWQSIHTVVSNGGLAIIAPCSVHGAPAIAESNGATTEARSADKQSTDQYVDLRDVLPIVHICRDVGVKRVRSASGGADSLQDWFEYFGMCAE